MTKYLLGLLMLAGTAFAQDSPHGPIKLACNVCHGMDSWQMKSDASFKHESTGFRLEGQHRTLKCQSCHEGLRFTKRTSNCLSCHADVHKSELGSNCVRCHTTTAWLVTDMVQKHQQTRFPLLGRHATVACQTCHTSAAEHQYAGTPLTCIGCHRGDFQATTSPNHASARFSTECANCHTVTASAWGTGFDHQLTRFPLTGAHQAQPCASCHTNNTFQGLSIACVSCHQQAYTTAANPNHVSSGFSTQCQTCHTTTAWQPATFNHAGTRFPLTGAHTTQPCQACHTTGNYHLVYTSCVQCHLADFQKTTNPSHVAGNFSQNCQTCHSTTAWTPATFDHNATKFPLTGEHARLQCQACHINGNYQLVYTGCAQCHQGGFDKTVNPNHTAGNFSRACETCHTTTAWSPATFDHSVTKFSLTGSHMAQPCLACHTNGNYQLVYTNCVQCHLADFQKTVNPNHVAGNFNQNCQTCHTTTAWTPATFDHSTTKFALTGAHAAQQCQSCHANNNYQLVYANCYQCHQTDFQGAANPNHVAGGFSQNCQTCHNTTAWQPSTFDHSSTKFALTGAHTAQLCQACHTNGNFQLVFTGCVQCHLSNYQATTNPSHVAGNFSQSCQTCHSTTSWSTSTFDHNTTKFALTGAHTAQPCQACHTNGNYQLVYANCYQCHQTDFQKTVNPNHLAGNFSQNCQTCHTTTAWMPATFDHSTTKFALTGAHTAQACVTCHTNGNYQLVFTNCFQCHQADFQAATTPNHVAGGFSQNCQTCHNTTAWQPSAFDHSTTKFALTGAHTAQPCQACHTNGNYQLVFTGCVQCHLSNYQATTNPNHVAGNFSQNCQTCHTTTAWQPASFDHSTTKFALTGAHTAQACQVCHTNGNYQLVFTNCYQCHQTDFQGAANPNHVTGGFSQNCQTCHNTTAWQPSTFDHSTTKFALSGAHLAQPCQNCHTNGNYQLVFTGCVQCHLSNFQATTNPNHVAGGFSQNCQTCHTTTAWQPATFDHSTTKFPLTGAHTAQACQACHTNGNYQLAYTGCVQCHLSNYQATTNPNHASAGFTTTCETCHTTTAWTGATFNHTWFPTTHGNAAGVCATCHTNPSDYTVFQCTNCHTQGTTNPRHSGVRGYVWNSVNCYQCHPTGTHG